MGLLKIVGTIRVDQFWPRGRSEADASKIKITVTNDSFSFAESERDVYKPVALFADAGIDYARKKSKVIKRSNQIICRLRGVDAPELNYAPFGPTPQKHPTKRAGFSPLQYQNLIDVINNACYRQPWAETSVAKLADYIANSGKGNEIPCVFLAHAQTPQDVCDCYGRFVGDVYIVVKKKEVSLNMWLLENGWAFPALYTDMDTHAVQSFLDAAKKGKEKKGGVYSYYRKFFGRFEDVAGYRIPAGKTLSVPDVPPAQGYLMLPKIFRVWCRYNIFLQAGIQPGSFTDFLNVSTTGFYYTGDFLNPGATIMPPTLLSAITTRNRFDAQPEDIVFVKRPSALLDKNGNPITEW